MRLMKVLAIKATKEILDVMKWDKFALKRFFLEDRLRYLKVVRFICVKSNKVNFSTALGADVYFVVSTK